MIDGLQDGHPSPEVLEPGLVSRHLRLPVSLPLFFNLSRSWVTEYRFLDIVFLIPRVQDLFDSTKRR